ncbi:unnamed protein product [Adineta steineri]|uniref:Uncharacterized protein n=1 Tax=Adineta steineri TaxID=433720 RepID=A0A815FZH7_9BILA|nr:unnamed protein product [Adineta steineri]CAF1331917.1 unnamed protein product [Adineta steineri]
MGSVEKVVGSDIVIIWLDDHIGQTNNCTGLKEEFQSNTTNIYLFHDVDQCIKFVQSIENKKLFCIIQGKHAKTMIPHIEKKSNSPVVYIFCFNTLALSEWAQNYDCILAGGIYDHDKDLLARLTKDLADYAAIKAQEYNFKRQACVEWAENLTKNAKRFRTEQCTLTFSTDPTDDNKETTCEQPE